LAIKSAPSGIRFFRPKYGGWVFIDLFADGIQPYIIFLPIFRSYGAGFLNLEHSGQIFADARFFQNYLLPSEINMGDIL
jgi:hypothetical protein